MGFWASDVEKGVTVQLCAEAVCDGHGECNVKPICLTGDSFPAKYPGHGTRNPLP